MKTFNDFKSAFNWAEKVVSDTNKQAIEDIAKQTNFIVRVRKFTAYEWLLCCLLWATNLKGTLTSLNHLFGDSNIHISNTGIHKRFNSKCVDFLKGYVTTNS